MRSMRRSLLFLSGLAALGVAAVLFNLSLASDARPAPVAAERAPTPTTALVRSDLATIPEFLTVTGHIVAGHPLMAELATPSSTSLVVGQGVELESVARPGEILHATLTQVGARTALVALPEGTRFSTGTFLEARIATTTTRALPQVPRTAVTRNGSSWRLWVAQDGKLTERVVVLGPASSPTHVTIARGLTAGEEVAVRSR